MYKKNVLSLFLLVGWLSAAQLPEHKEKDSVFPFQTVSKSDYILSYRKTFGLSAIMDIEAASLIFSGNGKVAHYTPNKSLRYGISIFYYWITLRQSFNLFSTNPQYSNSTSFDFNVRFFISQKFSAQFRMESTNGFYLSRYQGFNPSDYPVPFSAIRKDITAASLGLTLFYVPNGYKYSFKSLFNPLEVQKKRAGSPVARLSWSLNAIYAASPIFPDLAYTQGGPRRPSYYVYALGASAGYGYNFIAFKNFHLLGLAFVGPSYVWNDSASGNYSILGFNYSARLGIRYNSPRSQLGLSLSIDGLNYNSGKEGTASTINHGSSYIGLAYTYRFNVARSKVFDAIEHAVLFKFIKPRKQFSRP